MFIPCYMASSMSGQGESNPALWLATLAVKMELSCLLGTTHCVPQEKFPENHIINPLLTKPVWSRWLDIGLILFFASLWTSTSSPSIIRQKKNLANIQPSWPRTWSITHIQLYILGHICYTTVYLLDNLLVTMSLIFGLVDLAFVSLLQLSQGRYMNLVERVFIQYFWQSSI